MSIKYGELTIIHNKEQPNIFTYFFKNKDEPPPKSKCIFLFDDGEICEANDKLRDLHFYFEKHYLLSVPLWLKKPSPNNRHYFCKNPEITVTDICPSKYSQLFTSYSKYNSNNIIPSCYNSIYYCITELEVFGIVRVKSNDYMPRFLFAYDSDEFTKEEIVYLIYNIFGI